MKKISLEEHALLTESILKTLAQNRVTTISEFLQENIEKLCIITTLSLAEILDIRSHILLKYSAPLVDSATLLAKNVNIRKFILSNMPSLDAALEGGIPVGCITEICGLAGSGKTQLCFQFAINCAGSDCSVLYVNTKGDFSAIRIMKILEVRGYNHEQMKTIMSNIHVVHIWTLEESIELLKIVKTGVMNNLGLLIIDSLPTLMFQHLGDDNKIGLTMLNELVNNIRFVSKELRVAVVCVNVQTRWLDHDIFDIDVSHATKISTSTISDDEESNLVSNNDSVIERRNRCLGKYWQHIPSTLLMIEKYEYKQENNNSYRLQIQVYSYKVPKQNLQCTLKLDNLGICEF